MSRSGQSSCTLDYVQFKGNNNGLKGNILTFYESLVTLDIAVSLHYAQFQGNIGSKGNICSLFVNHL